MNITLFVFECIGIAGAIALLSAVVWRRVWRYENEHNHPMARRPKRTPQVVQLEDYGPRWAALTRRDPDRPYTAQQIKNMSVDEYKRERADILQHNLANYGYAHGFGSTPYERGCRCVQCADARRRQQYEHTWKARRDAYEKGIR